MNVTHKCHFHPNNTITKFCANSSSYLTQRSAPYPFATIASPYTSRNTNHNTPIPNS